MVIKKAKFEKDKLILNSHNKIKTTCVVINKESGIIKNRSEIQAIFAKTFNVYFFFLLL